MEKSRYLIQLFTNIVTEVKNHPSEMHCYFKSYSNINQVLKQNNTNRMILIFIKKKKNGDFSIRKSSYTLNSQLKEIIS